ncbi:MAG TPA: discoidin domain-containing protein, partial [Polyangiaceae bacterium]|nr:discoidin domain-containing protein [Polyangiaceae bacterium]
MKVSLCRARAFLPLLFMGACSFPEYAFMHPDTDTGGSAGVSGAAGAAANVSTCDDGVQGVNETGVDCGGVCKACPDTAPPPVCGDGVQGPDETGVDCGGVCPVCAAGQGCSVAADCESGNCQKSICRAATCSDGIENGAESDTDCGGRCLLLCKTGLRCNSESDCASGSCAAGLCRAPSCNDRVTNGDETGVDCGGTCPPCTPGMACQLAKDCASLNCNSSHLCVDPGCTDMTKNGLETDTDCGGMDCAPCAPKKHCKVNTDCDSVICDGTTKLCNAASCSDAVQNQGESDADCGGGACPACVVGKQCRGASDCASAVCQAKLCVPAAPTGMMVPENGWKASASDTFGDSSTKNLYDGDVTTRWTSGVTQYAGMWIQLDMGKPQIFFTVVISPPPDYTTDEG